MELQEAITARYSCRSFTERAIDSASLKTCVETAGWHSIVDLLRSCLKELRQIRDMLRTSQLVELQKVMKEAGVETEEAAE